VPKKKERKGRMNTGRGGKLGEGAERPGGAGGSKSGPSALPTSLQMFRGTGWSGSRERMNMRREKKR